MHKEDVYATSIFVSNCGIHAVCLAITAITARARHLAFCLVCGHTSFRGLGRLVRRAFRALAACKTLALACCKPDIAGIDRSPVEVTAVPAVPATAAVPVLSKTPVAPVVPASSVKAALVPAASAPPASRDEGLPRAARRREQVRTGHRVRRQTGRQRDRLEGAVVLARGQLVGRPGGASLCKLVNE